MLAVNLKGPFLCAQAAARCLGGGGAIVNVASLAGRSSSLAPGLPLLGIRVNAVCPGPILTDMLTRCTSTARIAELAAQVPVGRAGTPEDIAGVIAFLASDDAAYINGASLDVNGGIFMA